MLMLMLCPSEQAKRFCSMFFVKPLKAKASESEQRTADCDDQPAAENNEIGDDDGICRGYLSDLETNWEGYSDVENDDYNDIPVASSFTDSPPLVHPSSSTHVIPPPAPKRCRLDIPAHRAPEISKEQHRKGLENALLDIERCIASRKNQFAAGRDGLQSYRAQAILSCLHMVVNNHCRLIDASQIAAKSQGFAEKWGGQMVRQWVADWIDSCELPESNRGCHKKVWSISKLRSWLRTNKWSTNPQKLADFTKNKLLPDKAKKYLTHIVQEEMPAGLKKYLELELFPRVQMKVLKGISSNSTQLAS